jgi:hypothetical protein
MKSYYYELDGKVKVINAKSDPSQFLPEGATLLNEVDREAMPDTARKDLWTNDGSGNAEIKTADLTAAEREEKLQAIRDHREPLLQEADIQINILIDADGDATAWKTYRQALRDVTETYKADMSLLDAIVDVESDITWPIKP